MNRANDEEAICELYIDDYFSNATNTPGPSRRAIGREDLPMGINKEYVLIHKDDYTELLELRQEKAVLLSKLTDNIVGEY